MSFRVSDSYKMSYVVIVGIPYIAGGGGGGVIIFSNFTKKK